MVYYMKRVKTIVMFRSYIAHITSKWRLYALEALLPPALALMQPFSAIRAFEGINSSRVPIYYTWVERDNCGQNALPKGVRTEWDSNSRPSECREREPLHHSAPNYYW